MEFKETEPTISLHGLGFLQIKLGANHRMHVWHPDLPRRKCFDHSQIHDHRFAFISQVLVGAMENRRYFVHEVKPAKLMQFAEDRPTHYGYMHEGPRTKFGNRPWLKKLEVQVNPAAVEVVKAGDDYSMPAYNFHSTAPLGDKKVVTLMTKVAEYETRGATSLCEVGVEPDVDFNRFQLSEADMWTITIDALGASTETVDHFTAATLRASIGLR